MALEALHEETKHFGLHVTLSRTKVQVLRGLPNETEESIHAFGVDINILEHFTYLGNVVHTNGGSRQKVLWWIGPRCYGLIQHEYLAFSVFMQTEKDLDLQVASDSCLTV